MDLTVEGKAYIKGVFQDCCIGIEKGKISSIKKILKSDNHYNFGNNLILPSGIDIHVHFRDPGMTHKEDFASGTSSALYGGVSCVFDMPNTIPQTISIHNLKEKIEIASIKTYTDFGIYAGITSSNIQYFNDLSKISCGFKIFLGSTTNSLSFNSENLKEIFELSHLKNTPILIHAEDEQCLKRFRSNTNNLNGHLRSRPAECEETAINRILIDSKNFNSKIHICHLSSCEGIELLRKRASNITCGVTPHHLLLDISKHENIQAKYKTNPPIRTDLDREALFDGAKNGLIDILESDHAPHSIEEKEKEFSKAPSGVPGVETTYPLFLYLSKKNLFSYQQLISMFCEKPAELLNIPKGKIEIGKDADFIIVDYKSDSKITGEKLHSKCGWTPFENWSAVFPSNVFVRGERLIEDYELQGKQGFGKYVGE